MTHRSYPKASAEGLAPAVARVAVYKRKPCNARKGGCGWLFQPTRRIQGACGPVCAQRFVETAKAKQQAAAAALDRRQTRAKLEAMKTIPKLKAEAQRAFNLFVRTRDAHETCISCGAPPPDMSQLHAGRDAGHYRSTGSADHMRYVEDNCHAQCVKCNQWGAGMAVDYRIRLIERIGLARVDALERNNESTKWTRDGLREVREKYKQMARGLNAA